MSTSVYGVSAFEYAPITADGSLPTSGWKKVSPISDDAVTLEIPAVATNNIRAQDIPGIFEILPGDTDPAKFTVTQLQMDGATAADLLGGTWDSVAKKYDAPPTGSVIKKYAAKLTSQPLNGEQMVFWIRKGSVLSNATFSFVRNDLVKVSFTVTSLTPTDLSGNAVSPWGFQILTVSQTT